MNNTSDFKCLYIKAVGTWQIDLLYLVLIVPMGFIGTLLNLISLFIFISKPFRNIPLFQYMICYTTNSSIVTFSLVFYFIYCNTYMYDLVTSDLGRIFNCKIISLTGFFFFYSNALDVFINIERKVHFSNHYKKFKSVSPYLNGTILFVICLIIHLPINLAFQSTSQDEMQSSFKLCKMKPFGLTLHGRILIFISYLSQGPLVLFLVIFTNILSIISFKQFLKRKSLILSQNLNNKQLINKQKREEIFEKRLLFMTFYITLFSFSTSLVIFASQTSMFFSDSLDQRLVRGLMFLNAFLVAFKGLTNIFFFAFFNKNFSRSLIFWKIKIIEDF